MGSAVRTAVALLIMALPAVAQFDAWSNLHRQVQLRCAATARTNSGWQVPPVDAVQRYALDLGIVATSRHWTLIAPAGPPGPIVTETNIAGGRTNVWTWTNHVALSSETLRGDIFDWSQPWGPIYSTNFVVTIPTNVLAEFPGLPSNLPHRVISADTIAEIDAMLQAAAPAYVDTVAISNAGGLSAWLAAESVTNWYWVDTNSDRTNDAWQSVTRRPLVFPRWTVSNLWRAAGIEPLVVSRSVATVTNVVEGWTVGQLGAEYVTNVATVTNLVEDYAFTQRATSRAYRATIGQLRAGLVTNAGVTNVAFVSQRMRPLDPPETTPDRLLTNAALWVQWTPSVVGARLPTGTVLHVTGLVMRVDASGMVRDAVASEAVTLATATNRTPLTNRFHTLAGMSCAAILTNKALIGSELAVVWSNTLLTMGGATVARGTNAVAERWRVLRHLNWTVRDVSAYDFSTSGWGRNSNAVANYPTYYATSCIGSCAGFPSFSTGIWPDSGAYLTNDRVAPGAVWRVNDYAPEEWISGYSDSGLQKVFNWIADYDWPKAISLASTNLPTLAADVTLYGNFGIQDDVTLVEGGPENPHTIIAAPVYPMTITSAHVTVWHPSTNRPGTDMPVAWQTNVWTWTNDLVGLPIEQGLSAIWSATKSASSTALSVTNLAPVSGGPGDSWLTFDSWREDFYVWDAFWVPQFDHSIDHTRGVVPGTTRELRDGQFLLRWVWPDP